MNNQQTFPSPQKNLGQFAYKLRALYWMCRNLTYGHGDEEIWLELARSLSSKMVPIDLFIDSQFYSMKKLYRPPSPRELLGKKAYDRYEKYRERKAEQIENSIRRRLRNQKNRARGEVISKIKDYGITEEEAISDTICSNFQRGDFSPLFCYTLLSQVKKLSNQTERYFLKAVLEYVPLREEYDEVWGTDLPKGFRDLALKTYCELFAPDYAVTQ